MVAIKTDAQNAVNVGAKRQSLEGFGALPQ